MSRESCPERMLGAGILGALLAAVDPWSAAGAIAYLLAAWVVAIVVVGRLRDGGTSPEVVGGDALEVARRVAALDREGL